MGVFFVSLGVDGFLSGKLASLTSISPEETSVLAMKAHYANAFTQITGLLIASLLVCLLLNRLIKRTLKDSSSNSVSDSSLGLGVRKEVGYGDGLQLL
jgi:POT family proton-dependent oligopeptide transporter